MKYVILVACIFAYFDASSAGGEPHCPCEDNLSQAGQSVDLQSGDILKIVNLLAQLDVKIQEANANIKKQAEKARNIEKKLIDVQANENSAAKIVDQQNESLANVQANIRVVADDLNALEKPSKKQRCLAENSSKLTLALDDCDKSACPAKKP